MKQIFDWLREQIEAIVHTMIAEYPTEEEAIEAWNNRPTEAEIRNKAIDEFAEKLKGFIRQNIDDAEYIGDGCCEIFESEIDEIAEQLKGGMRNAD